MSQEALRRTSRYLIAGLIYLLFILLPWTSFADTATPISTTAASLVTPSPDPTVIALQRSVLENQKLIAEITKLHHDIQPSVWDILVMNFPVTAGALVGIIGIWRWIADRRDARQKSIDERFQSAIEWLGSKHEATRVQAATILINFLQPGYEQYYKQIFDLSVVNLSLQRPELPDNIPQKDKVLSEKNQEIARKPLFLVLVRLFKNSTGRARAVMIREKRLSIIRRFNYFLRGIEVFLSPKLDARFIYLNYASLSAADLRWVDLRGADLRGADLRDADLRDADLRGADLQYADLQYADLRRAHLQGAHLQGTNLQGADLQYADLRDAINLTTNQVKAAIHWDVAMYNADFTA